MTPASVGILILVAVVYVFALALAKAAGEADARIEAMADRRREDRIVAGVMSEIARADQLYRALMEEYDDPYVGAEDTMLRGQALKDADEWLDAVAHEAGAVWLEARLS